VVSFLVGFVICVHLAILKLRHESWVTNRPAFFIAILLMILGVNIFTTGMLAEFHNAHSPRRPKDHVRERLSADPSA
jgi:hypothetical protein